MAVESIVELRRQAARAATGVRRWSASRYVTLVGGLVIAVLTWPTSSLAPSYGLDPSWVEALHLAQIRGISYGSSFVWTYGPLGYLSFPVAVSSSTLVQAMVFSTVARIAYCVLLLHLARRAFPLSLALVIAYVGAQLPVSRGDAPVFVLLLYALASLDDPTGAVARTFPAVGPILAAVALFTKTSSGAVAVGIWAVCTVSLGRNAARRIVYSPAIFVVAALALWLATGNALGQLPEWLRLSESVVSGYGQAMQSDDHLLWQLEVGLLLLALLALSLARRSIVQPRLRVAGFLIVGAFAFLFFKEGFVRQDIGHTPFFFTATAVAAFAVMSRDVRIVPAGVVVVCVLAVQHSIGFAFTPMSSPRAAYDQWLATADTHRRGALVRDSASYQRSVYGIPDAFLSEIGDRTVAVYPHDTAIIGAYDLRWDPLPVVQQYQANTPLLDRLNASKVSGSDAPERLIRELDTASQTAYAPSVYAPATYRAILCSYAQMDSTPYFQLLRHTRSRCGAPRVLERVTGHPGVGIPVPRAGRDELVIARIHVGMSTWNKLLDIVYKPDMPTITVGTYGTSLLPTATAPAGLIVHVPPTSGWDARFDGAIDARTITVSSTGSPIHVEFDALPLAAAS